MMADWLTIVATPVLSAAAAGVTAFLGANLSERAKLRWTKRSEVFTRLYSTLTKIFLELDGYCKSQKLPTEEQKKKLGDAFNALVDYSFESAIFMPDHIRSSVEALTNRVRSKLGRLIIMAPPEGTGENRQSHDLMQSFFGYKGQVVGELKEGGEIYERVREIEAQLRRELGDKVIPALITAWRRMKAFPDR